MMFKALFKKQLMEINVWLFIEKKTGKKRSKNGVIFFAAGYILLLGFTFGSLFFGIASMLCRPLSEANMTWLYFGMMGLVALMAGVFGSVFSTYSSLYLAKDNDMLLSFPIKPSLILFVRLFGVWMWGAIFEGFAFVPAIIAYIADVEFNARSMFFSIIILFLLSVLVLVLSCILGWAVAKISIKLKNKSIVTVLISLLFLGLYFAGYSKAYAVLQKITVNAVEIGEKIEKGFYPIYALGRACEGDVLSLIIFAAIVLVLSVAVYVIMTRTFLKIVTSNHGSARKEYKGIDSKKRSVNGALFSKELKRFTSSPNYMLNCALGSVFMTAFGIIALIKGKNLLSLTEAYPEILGYIPLIACAASCSCAAMNDITAPSVSLEGRNIWLIQSLPVEPQKALLAKIKLHLAITEPPAIFCAVCVSLAVRSDAAITAVTVVCTVLMVLFCASFGLAVNLKMPNLKWTNEIIPIKQSLSVLISMFGGLLMILVFAGMFFVLKNIISPPVFLVICAAVLAAISAALLNRIKTKGAEIFSQL